MFLRLFYLFLFTCGSLLLNAQELPFSESDTIRIAREDTSQRVWVVAGNNQLYYYHKNSQEWSVFPHSFNQKVLFIDPCISENILLVITAQQSLVFNVVTQKQIGWFPVDSAIAYCKMGEGVFAISTLSGLRYYAISNYSFHRNIAIWEVWKSFARNDYSDSALIAASPFHALVYDTTLKTLYAKSDTQLFRLSPLEYLQPCDAATVSFIEEHWKLEDNKPIQQPPAANFIAAADTSPVQSQVEKIDKPVFYKTVWFGFVLALLLFAMVALIVFSYLRNSGKRNAAAFQKSTLKNTTPAKAPETPKHSPVYLQHLLDWIQSYVLKGEKIMAYELLQKFKELMLLSLAMDNKKEVTLEEEIKFLSTYLELEQSRLNGRLDFLIKADDNVSLQRKIPAMLLLPYVLEAVERSLQPITEPGRIWIVFKISGMSLQVIIDDNGLSRNCAVPGFEIDNRISFYPGEKTGNRVALSL